MKRKYITPCVTLVLLPSTQTQLLITSIDGDTDFKYGGASPEEMEEEPR